MKKILLLAFLLIPFLGFAQEDGIGLRLGEPLTITYKKFLDDQFALEAMIGRGSPNSSNYYRRAFDRRPATPNAFYASHAANSGFSLSLRGMLHEDITDDLNIGEGYLLAYAGAGAQLRSIGVSYAYTDPSISTAVFRDDRTNIDFGAEAFGGAEYYFNDLPISVFAEIGLFMEVLDRFGHLRLQGGIGIRYLF